MENIQVAMRLRPLNQKEEDKGESMPWKVKSNCIEIDRSLSESGAKKGIGKQQFFYDHCFPGHINNEQIYATVVKKVIMSCLEGYNGTIFMYGQTGSGKTYTMLGYKNQDGVYNQGLTEDQKTKAMLKEDVKLEQGDTPDADAEDNLHEKFADYMYDCNKVDMAGNSGILIQSLKDIFKAIEQDEEKTYFLKCSYFEIYNDQIYDLLAQRNTMHESLNLMEDAKKDHFVIKGLTEHSVTSIKEILEKLKKGEVNRHYAQTYMNHSSSRSHTLFRVTVKAVTNNFIRMYRQENKGQSNLNLHHILAKETDENAGTIVTESYLNFVDLAGSERITSHVKWIDEEFVDEGIKEQTKTIQDSRMKEGKSINKSLFFLTQVISLKAEGKANQYIPFRNSPLTKILRSSLGGNFRTLVVLCINPCVSQIEISLSTLRFGVNAKKIENSVKANIVTNNNDESIRILIDNYERKMRDIQNQRDEDLGRYQHFTTIIDELRMQRSILLERLEQANKKLSVHIVDEIPERELHSFFRQAQTKTAVVGQAGLLFVPKSQSKYDEIYDLDMDGDHSMRLKKKFDNEMRITSKDFVNKFALQAYNKVKKDFIDIKTTSEKHQDYLSKLCESFQTLRDFMGHLSSLGEVYLAKLHTMSEQYQDEYVLANERHLKLELYEKFKGMTLLSDADLMKMKEYVIEFNEGLVSELDRRELMKNKELPADVIEGLNELNKNEREEQEDILKQIKDKMINFATFRQGCSSEIDYYRQMCKDFTSKHEILEKAKQIENFINNEMVGLTMKVKQMEENLKENDVQLATHEKKNLDKKLAEYQTKFEKLVDVVLSHRPGGSTYVKERLSERLSIQDNISVRDSPDSSVVGNSPTRKLGFLRKSHSINFDEDNGGPKAGDRFEKGTHDKKIRQWITLKAIEEEPMCYNSMIRDDESVWAGSIQMGQPQKTGNNLATINEKISNDGDMSEKNLGFDIKGNKNKKGVGGDNPFRREERKSYAAGNTNSMAQSPTRAWEERRSHVVGRSNIEDKPQSSLSFINTPLMPAKYDRLDNKNSFGSFGDPLKEREKVKKITSDSTEVKIALLQAIGGIGTANKSKEKEEKKAVGSFSPLIKVNSQKRLESPDAKQINGVDFLGNERFKKYKGGRSNRDNGGLEDVSSCSSGIDVDGKSKICATLTDIKVPDPAVAESATTHKKSDKKEKYAFRDTKSKSKDVTVRNHNAPVPGQSKALFSLTFSNNVKPKGGPSGKELEYSHRVFGNIDKERVSYKSHHNGRDSRAEPNYEDPVSVENMEVKINEPSVVHNKNPNKANGNNAMSKSTTFLQRNKSNELQKNAAEKNLLQPDIMKSSNKTTGGESIFDKQTTAKKSSTGPNSAVKKGSVRELVAATQFNINMMTPPPKEDKVPTSKEASGAGTKLSSSKDVTAAIHGKSAAFDPRDGQRESVTSVKFTGKKDDTKKTSVRDLLANSSSPNKKSSFLAEAKSSKDIHAKVNTASKADLLRIEDSSSKPNGRKSAEPTTTKNTTASKTKGKQPQPEFYTEPKVVASSGLKDIAQDKKQTSTSLQGKRPGTTVSEPQEVISKPLEKNRSPSGAVSNSVFNGKPSIVTESTAGSFSKGSQPRGHSAIVNSRPLTGGGVKTSVDKRK